jgi:hypothetical protein
MTRAHVQFRTFKSYALHHARAKKTALALLEQNGVAAALERCRALAEQIHSEIHSKSPDRLDIGALAEFQVALERAASVHLELTEPSRPKRAPIISNPPQPSRRTAGASGFLNLSQSGERPDR